MSCSNLGFVLLETKALGEPGSSYLTMVKFRSVTASCHRVKQPITPLNTARDTKGNYGNEKQQLSAIIEARKLQAVREQLQNEVLLSERWTGCFTVVASLSL
ncbi:hypothetical protein OIU78_024092 [Salix suchowensis]|nr:hypothetical protein OIU78_024092 [Salix suchowensis]